MLLRGKFTYNLQETAQFHRRYSLEVSMEKAHYRRKNIHFLGERD